MSLWLFFVGCCIGFGWFYDESQFDPRDIAIATCVCWGLAFIAWIVERFTDAMKEGK